MLVDAIWAPLLPIVLVREADFLVGVQGPELLVEEEQLHVEEAGVVEQVHLVEEADAAVVADKTD